MGSDNWYDYLEDLSITDSFYDLVYDCVPHNWQPHQNFDFVVLRTSAFSGNIFPKGNMSKTFPREEYCFPENDYVVLDEEVIGVYMNIAKRMTSVQDAKGREFIELLYHVESNTNIEDAHEKWQLYLQDYEERRGDNIDRGEAALIMAYELLKTGTYKTQALEYARKGEEFLCIIGMKFENAGGKLCRAPALGGYIF